MVQAGKTDCFYYAVLPDQVIDVEYQVIDSTHGELDVSFQLADPVGRILVADYKKPENSHRHTAQVHGDYRFCFDNTFSTFSQKTVFFDVMINGADSDEKDYDDDKEMELNDGTQSYMVKVQDISESVTRVKEHMNTARRLQELLSAHEARDRNLAEEMCTRVMRWSLIQIVMMVAVGLMQMIMPYYCSCCREEMPLAIQRNESICLSYADETVVGKYPSHRIQTSSHLYNKTAEGASSSSFRCSVSSRWASDRFLAYRPHAGMLFADASVGCVVKELIQELTAVCKLPFYLVDQGANEQVSQQKSSVHRRACALPVFGIPGRNRMSDGGGSGLIEREMGAMDRRVGYRITHSLDEASQRNLLRLLIHLIGKHLIMNYRKENFIQQKRYEWHILAEEETATVLIKLAEDLQTSYQVKQQIKKYPMTVQRKIYRFLEPDLL
ncbi:Transmembrane emp24 domain-containing protein 5 [Eumeta japonica]|uniref:Transmembrane emp24 domain-containing protein 5 n=1 Tax=Eumeta variegata TaxID=151549 RepID=A0A4C1ULI8_EUMVA|nr:Transmembrane emp24 domain-containing protein 5 [Eumeta japonica]